MLGGTTLGVLAACALLATACLSAEDRADSHLRSAEEHLDAGRVTEALIELNNALRLDPDDAAVSRRIADVLALSGKYAEARFYYGEAYRLDPQRIAAAVQLAGLERGHDPERAREIVEELRERHPDSAWVAIAIAEQSLADADTAAGLEAAERAVSLAPELPEAHLALARVHMGRIRESALARETAADEVFESALAALARFAELDPRQRWRALDERSSVLAAWPGHAEEADAALREAAAVTAELGLRAQQLAVLDRAFELGRKSGRFDLQEWALEQRVAVAPRSFEAWHQLSLLHTISGRPAIAVYERLVQALPDDPDAHVAMARHLERTRGLRAGVRYLERRAADDLQPAAMLAEKARMQLRAGNRAAAFTTVGKLEALDPDARETVRMVAWRWLESGRPRVAIRLIEDQPWAADDASARRLLVDARMRLGDPAGARADLERLLELIDAPERRLLTLRAQLLLETGDARSALDAYTGLLRHGPLEPVDQTRLALALYETGGPKLGRRLLEQLVDAPEPEPRATLELFAREGADPELVPVLRKGFAALANAAHRNLDVLRALTHFEIRAGTPERAVKPLLRAVRIRRKKQLPTGELELLEVEIARARDDIEGARRIALAVLEREPALPDALPTAASLYPTRQEALAGIEALTKGRKAEEQSAARHALLGRLYHRAGNPVMARWSLEQALTGGLELPILKNDLAFLLAQRGIDLPRARLLARQAVQGMPREPGALDTLGFVLLEMGDAKQAAIEFRRAIELAEALGSPRAELHYHLGLAYAQLEQRHEAELAFQTALGLGEEFADADAARRQLARVRGEI